MKKIYWIINQFNNDDASISAIEIANRLVQYRSISIIVLGPNLNINSNVSGKIDIIYFDIDEKYYKDDILTSYFKSNKNVLKDKISELTTKNDIIISTSYLSSYIVPKGRRFLYYYIGKKESFFKFKEKQRRNKLRNPDNYIITSLELKEVLDKKKKYRGAYQIYPCSTLYQSLDLSLYNTISYLYNNGDDYNLPIDIINSLKENGCIIKLKYYANEEIINKIKHNIIGNGLTKYVELISEYEINDVYKKCDLFIDINKKSSISLFMIESLSQGKPLISYKNEILGESNSIIIDNKNLNNTSMEIKDIFNKQKKLEKYKQSAFNLSLKFSKEMIIAKWLDILEIEDNLVHKE